MKKKLLIVLTLVLTLLMLVSCGKKTSNNMPPKEDKGFKTISTNDLKDKLDNKSWVIVDTRINDAYNGWKLDGVERGGHIKGATDFSANWIDIEEDKKEEKLDNTLQTKSISKDKNIVLYDSNNKDSKKVADYLKGKGYKNIYLYNVKEWAKDSKFPMEKYKNYQVIVPAAIVKDVIDGKKPESFETADKIKIVEASWGKASESYSKGHIPTACHINTDMVEPPPQWMLASDDKLTNFAKDFGFTKDDTVIVTGKDPMAAYRVSLVLRYIGVKDVRVLNGGDDSWVRAGYNLETKETPRKPGGSFGAKIPMNPDVIDTIPELKKELKDKNFTLVDNRSWKEYIGEESGYSYYNKKGRIPGAVYGYAGTKSTTLEDYRNIDKTMRNEKEIKELWNKQKIDTNKHLSFMCGSGWRASEVYTYAKVMGLEKISVYSDGWIGWSKQKQNPIVTGIPKNE